MSTWPDQLKYKMEGYGWDYKPAILHTQYASGNTRQRLMSEKNDEVFDLSMRLDSSELKVFESFVLDTLNNGADEYTGPYFMGNVERQGTLEIIDGVYSVNYLDSEQWDVDFTVTLKSDAGQCAINLYDLVECYGGFSELNSIIKSTDEVVNK